MSKKNSNYNKLVPTAVEITGWKPYQKVIYKCSNCGQEFRFYGEKEKYCHNCGVKVRWKKVALSLSERYLEELNSYCNSESELIDEINKTQLVHNKEEYRS